MLSAQRVHVFLAGGCIQAADCQRADEGRWTVHYEWTEIEWWGRVEIGLI
jgi:hypothetical protein